jgi:FkbM family methyltransferase
MASGEGVIDRGPGRGLRIDAASYKAGYISGTSDWNEQQWLARTLLPGDTFYDVGASVGFFTLIGARLVGAYGSVVAFEPLPQTFEYLRRNVALNGFDHVTVVPTAVGANVGTARLGSPSGDPEQTRLLTGDTEVVDPIDSAVTTIDAWRAEDDPRVPRVMKIDVEGSELDVLRGAAKTIRETQPLMLVEVHWLGTDFVDYVDSALRPLGYEAWALEGGPLPTVPKRCHAVLLPNRP